MAKVTLRPDLDEVIARMITPKINEIAHEVAPQAQALAPGTKTWMSVGDDRVRDPHVRAHGQTVPENARFKLTAFEWDLQHPGASVDAPIKRGDGSGWSGPGARTVPGVHSYLLEPRDPTGGHFVQIVNCRCSVVRNPGGIKDLIHVEEAVPKGTLVQALIVAEGEGVMEAEHGDVYPFPVATPVMKGSLFMHRAAIMAANAIRARQ